MCSNCGENEAEWMNPDSCYEDEGKPFWCEKCLQEAEKSGCGEPECLLPVYNSPRMGVCGYEGSDTYPDQFVPDNR